MKKISNCARINVKGINLNNLINTMISSNIQILNLDKINSKEIEFSINDKDLKKISALDLKNYEIQTVLPSKKQQILHFLSYRIGLIIGLIVSIILLFVMQNRMININIIGLQNMEKSVVEEKLNEFGLKKFSYMNFDKSSLEKYLCDELNFSFVSVITKGNTLIISVKEELPGLNDKYCAITSDYNMIITKINVYSGTSLKKVGDIVYMGDVLVEPYEIKDNEKIDVVPRAEIEGTVYISEFYEFIESETIKVRTGNKKVIDWNMCLGKIKLFGNTSENPYVNFELENVDSMISSYFLPLRINKVIVYELEEKVVTKNFDDEKDTIIDDLKEKAYSKVTKDLKDTNEKIVINSTNVGNIVTIYLKSSVYLKYDNN